MESKKVDSFLFTIFISMILPVLITGCATVEDSPFPAGLPGMIYDNFNNPVDGAEIQLIVEKNDHGETGEVNLTSDIDGRFLLPPINPGDYDISINRAGFESRKVHFGFTDPRQVLYVKLTSLRYLRREIEDRLRERDLSAAGRLIERAAAVDPRDPILIYLTALNHYYLEEFDIAAVLLEDLESRGVENRGIDLLKEDLEQKHRSPGDKSDEE